MVARDIELCALTGARYHVAHVSSAESVRLVRDAKRRGLPVTCEVTPHHLTLTDEACARYDTSTKCNPPLRTAADVEALREALADGTIDASRPTTRRTRRVEKDVEFEEAAFGMIGLETALPLVLELVARAAGSARPTLVDAHDRRRPRGVRPAGRDAGATARPPTWPSSIRRRAGRSTRSRCAHVAQHAVLRAEPCAGRAVLTVVGGTIAYSRRKTDVSHDENSDLPPALLAMEDGTVFRGCGFGARGDGARRDRLQHRDHRLPGGPDRSVVPRPDRRDDRARDRQRRRQPGRLRVAAPVVRRLRRARAVAAGVELARAGVAATRCSPSTASRGIAGIDTRALTRRIRAIGRAARA